MTRPAKIGHVGTNYTPPHNISFSVLGWSSFILKVGNFYVPTCPIFAGPSHKYICTDLNDSQILVHVVDNMNHSQDHTLHVVQLLPYLQDLMCN